MSPPGRIRISEEFFGISRERQSFGDFKSMINMRFERWLTASSQAPSGVGSEAYTESGNSIQLMILLAVVSMTADRKSTRLNSSHVRISYAVFCLKKKKHTLSINNIYRTLAGV